ncbi:MAG: hypothetical protein JW819_07645 [Candidatus Krumholzibacteriota bacterium]|nr:hypothetical protein [Candidatus Krumholzibacteriota bacterium]
MNPLVAIPLLLVLLLALSAARLIRRNRLYHFEIWLRPWLRRRRELSGRLPPVGPDRCRDLLFCFVDHFEPGTREADPEQSAARFRVWTEGWPALASRFADSDGRRPQHSFFFPPHYFSDSYLRGLAAMDWQGVGETELHLHHENDDSASLRALLEETVALYARFGVLACQGDPVTRRYAFIHGNWALDNSLPGLCGVNDELSVLQATGCYADFTFPSLHRAQPRMVNVVYRAVDDPDRPKSYDHGRPLRAGRPPAPDEFLLVTGPLGLRLRRQPPFVAVEDADVTGGAPGTPERVRRWVRQGIHVAGRPEWIFVKVHTHGAPEEHREALLGRTAERMYAALCEEYGDGVRWRLHFVTAREMANIARAAEDGRLGDAGRYRDYWIPPYLTRSLRCSGRYEAAAFLPPAAPVALPRLELRLESPGPAANLELRAGLLRRVRGPMAALEITPAAGGAAAASGAGGLAAPGAAGELVLTGSGEVELFLLDGAGLRGPQGPLAVRERILEGDISLSRFVLQLDAGTPSRLEALPPGQGGVVS